ncbi:MAG: CPBP family intramembrane glutamic endopeptidase [Acidimicrobiia bacterium]
MPNDLTSTGRARAWSWPLEDWDQMWKPSMWLRNPPEPHKAHVWHLVAILALASYANVIANLVLEDAWHIPFNLGVLAVALLIARRAGTTWTSMGLRTDRLKRGLIVGGSVILVIGVGVAVAVAIPQFRELFLQERLVDESAAWLLFQALIRIPLATALYEEVLFRGIVFGMLVRRYSPLKAALISSVLFGFWHILPTFVTDPLGDTDSTLIGIGITVVGTVAGTMVAGLAFLWVRLFANSTLAPVLAHIGTNSVSMLGALVVIHIL